MGQAIAEDLRALRGIPPQGTSLEPLLRLGTVVPRTIESRIPEIDRYSTGESDPSQTRAVMQARVSPGLVVEGPPGTGKSQTIVNMVADTIGRGSSVLIVCQQQPALDVVRKRLEAEGFGSRVVMITRI